MKSQPRGAVRRATPKVAQTTRRTIDWSAAPRIGQTLLGAVLLIATLGGMGYWLVGEVQRPINQVEVSGDLVQVSAEQVQAILNEGLAKDGGVEPDLALAQQQLLENPWIEQVVMRRRWPDRLLVQVIERRAVARWGGQQLMTAKAELFAPEDQTQMAGLPLLSGPEGSAMQVLQHYGSLQEQLKSYGLKLVDLALEARGAWRMKLVPEDNREHQIAVYLGRDEMNAKMARLDLLLRKGLAESLGQIDRIDLRYSNGAALTWTDTEKAQS